MYEEYYGFAHSPFSLTPDPRFLYRSESHDHALQQVWQAIRRKEGFIVLTGDIGTGKTTLCRTILEQFDPTTFTALILNPFLSLDELLREVLMAYGVVSREAFRSGRLAAATRHELIRTLHDFLLSLEPIHGSAVLIIDEAQHLSPEVLEEIRILSNLETNERKLLLIVLVGQLTLLDVLRDAKLRQLDQRISIRCLLQPLTREGVEAYITHRLWVARGSAAVTFTTDAIDLVHTISGGVPRVINLLCDRALMAGADAQSDKISDAQIREAATNLGLAIGETNASRRRSAGGRALRTAAVAALVVLATITAAYALMAGNPLELLSSPTPPTVAVPTPPGMTVPAPMAPPAPATLDSLEPPSIETGAFSVIVGTYETPRETEAIVRTLRTRGLPIYAVDITMPDGIRRRRLLVGRYAAREDAVKARTDLSASFPDARIIYGWFERVP
jgi:general secretion pathway protein A